MVLSNALIRFLLLFNFNSTSPTYSHILSEVAITKRWKPSSNLFLSHSCSLSLFFWFSLFAFDKSSSTDKQQDIDNSLPTETLAGFEFTANNIKQWTCINYLVLFIEFATVWRSTKAPYFETLKNERFLFKTGNEWNDVMKCLVCSIQRYIKWECRIWLWKTRK